MGLLQLWTFWRARKLRPGQRCPVSGQYVCNLTGKQATCVKGKAMPPGPHEGTTWRLTDPTRHMES